MATDTNDVNATNGNDTPEVRHPFSEEPTVQNVATQPAQPVQSVQQVSTIADVQPQPVFTQSVQPLTSEGGVGAPKKRSKILLPVIFAGFLLFGGSAAAYVTVYQRSPEKIWARALNNTANGLDSMLRSGQDTTQKGLKMEGTVDVKSPIVVDAEMNGSWLENNGSFVADVNTSGVRMNVELRSIAVEGSESPDIYMKVDGLEQVSSLLEGVLGADTSSLIDAVNNQWFYADHTLLDQYLQSSDESTDLTLTPEDQKQISDKLMMVMRDRFFASDEKGVFTLSEKIGKEKFENTDAYKVRVTVNKENFKLFAIELKDAIKGTKLEELLKVSDPEKTLEEVLSFDAILEQLDKTDFSKASADAWIEANGGFIRNVRVYPEQNNTTNYIDFGLNYTGGDSFPLSIKMTIDDEGTKGTFGLGMDVNPKTQSLTMTLNADMMLGEEAFDMDAKISMSGTNDAVTVEEPEDAVNILEFAGLLQGSALESYDALEQETLLEADSLLFDDTELTQ